MSIYDASVTYAERGTFRCHPRRQGIRLRLSPRLGRQGPAPARHPRRHRRKLRAHPPLNLVGMGILPLQFSAGETVESHGLTGEELYSFPGLKAMLDSKFADGKTLHVQVTSADGVTKLIAAKSASTPRRRSPTSNTAASCSTSCAQWH
jgi:aconitate hydratase